MKKTKKALFPFLAGALLLTMGLTACNNAKSDKPASSGDTSEVEETKINVTAAGDKTTLKVGETVQLSADVEGVEWSTRAGTVVSVDKNGLVTALGAGSGKVTAKKDGYANGSITITVEKAPDREPNYSLRLEEAEHYDPDDFWGMDLSEWGMVGVMGPGDSPVEDNGGATDDGTSLGWLTQGCKETMRFTSNKAAKVELGVTMAYNAEMSLDGVLSVKFNGKEISMAGRTVAAPEDGESYYEFNTVSFGQVDLIAGENVLEIEMLAQGPNMDKVVIFTSETLQIASVPAQAKPKIEVVEAEIEIQVDGEKQIQVKNNLAGVAYKSADETVATVSDAGVVKGIKAGKTTVEVTKDGYKKATVNVTVKAKPVAGQIVIEAEDAILPEGTTIQMENGGTCSGGKSLGYFGAEQTFELKYTAAEAKEYKLSMVVSSAAVKSDFSGFADMELTNEVMTMKFNNTAIDLGSHTLPGSSGWTKTWVEIDLGNINIVTGENTFSFAAITQGPNIDCIKLTDPNAQPETPVEDKVTVSFDANGGSGTMNAVQAAKGEYTLPECTFTAPGTKVFAGWEVTVTMTYGQYSWEQAQVKQPGEKIDLTKDTTIKATWKVNIVKSAQVDLTNAFVMEAEDAVIAGAQTQQGGSPVEDNESSHGGKDVGYMATGASITFNFNASAAGKAKLILMGRSASANWMVQPVVYNDHALEETTSIKANNADVDVAGKGFLGSDAKTSVQVDLGEIDINAGANTIVISALQQAPNIDCIALIADGITFTLPQA